MNPKHIFRWAILGVGGWLIYSGSEKYLNDVFNISPSVQILLGLGIMLIAGYKFN